MYKSFKILEPIENLKGGQSKVDCCCKHMTRLFSLCLDFCFEFIHEAKLQYPTFKKSSVGEYHKFLERKGNKKIDIMGGLFCANRKLL